MISRAGARAPALVLLVMLLASACASVVSETDGGTPTTPDGGNADGGAQERMLDDRGAVGSLGIELLSGSFPRASVEIDSTPDETMTDAARRGLRDALAEHGSKSVSFAGESNVEPRDVYSTEDLRALSQRHRSVSSSDGTIAIHVLVLSGRHRDESTLGIAFDATTFAIFPDRIRSGILSSVNHSAFEHAVVVHELGHLFGLVNLTGEGGFHEDPDNPGHSENEGSVMFWAVEDISIGNVFRGGPPTSFDADDEREMQRIRS